MTEDNYVIRPMKKSEVKFAINLARKETWNPGIHDSECFYAADPNGFFIGLLDGKPISCISAVRYNDNYGFVGLYIVKEKYREHGFGTGIGSQALEYLEGVDIGIDGVAKMVDTYKNYGFEEAYRNNRYGGTAIGLGYKKTDLRIRELSKVDFDDLVKYDEENFSVARPRFLKCWINQPHSVALGIMDGNQLAGYAVLRKCFIGYKIGPLFANNEDFAEALFLALSSRIKKGTTIYLDVPGEEQNPAATALVLRHKMELKFSTARMYRMAKGGKLRLPLHHWFGVTSFELG